MKVKNKNMLFNKYIITSSIMIFVISLASFCFFSNFIWNIHLGLEITLQNASFDNYPRHGYTLMQVIAPVFASTCMLSYVDFRNNASHFYPRVKSYQGYILKKMFQYILMSCISMYVAYLLFLFLGAAVLKTNHQVDRYLFVEITGWNFSNEHPVLYFMLEGFVRYVVFMFVYCLFAVAISFLTSKRYLYVLIPLIYFDLLAMATSMLERLVQLITGAELLPNLMFLAPTYTVMSNSREYINGFAILFPLMPVLVFSVCVIGYRLYFDRRRDVYGIS